MKDKLCRKARMLMTQSTLNSGHWKTNKTIKKNKGKYSMILRQKWHKLVWEFLGFECGGNSGYLWIKVHKFIWKMCVRLMFEEGFHSQFYLKTGLQK